MSAVAERVFTQEPPAEPRNYLNTDHTLKSWLLTTDHKRIAVLYLISVTIMFFMGSIAAAFIRFELTSPWGQILTNEAYNKTFTAHGVLMIFFFLIPAVPAVLGNFLVPLQIGARDLAFPRLNLASWYVYIISAVLVLSSLVMGGVDTGWTFYVPLSSLYSNTPVSLMLVGLFLSGFSSIMTAVNFIATIHKMRAPGMTWFKLPLFIWAHYATSVTIILGTPVVAITLLLVVLERTFGIGIFSPELGGDPVLFQHLFWFYSHPAVYIMVLPAMGVISELVTCFSRRQIFGYQFVAMSSMAIAAIGFLVWGHHMYVSSQSVLQGIVFSLLSFLVAVPSAVKVFNWTLTMWKGSVLFRTPMIYALAFLGLFVIGGLTGLYLSSLDTDVHLTATYFVVAHFHYVMVGGSILAFLGGIHFWWPKMFGVMYSEFWGRLSAMVIFIGFNFTFFPQFIVGYLGMPRRYHLYYFAPEWQFYHVASSLGSTVLGIGFLMPAIYLTASLVNKRKGEQPLMPHNPWGAKGLEWEEAATPPITLNFERTPMVTEVPYNYDPIEDTNRVRAEKGLPLIELDHDKDKVHH
ncbi:MAG: cbb3-type cytochrome c oxidase subunit I [Fimbriimonadaceae bacterium]|nr:cbb3-type cytochrome c oxidase subunit I [Fimbriimonadaceae bacterium]QYK56410.1 MAG: cbb3-type cytochrome c oxidase subunit I [Fimbriimonadaceae bacterium]